MRLLSDDWFDERLRLARLASVVMGFDARIQHVVASETGEVRYYDLVQDGRIVDSARGEVPNPHVTVHNSWRDELALVSGELDPVLAVGLGTIRLEGDQARLLPILPYLMNPEAMRLRGELLAVTETPEEQDSSTMAGFTVPT